MKPLYYAVKINPDKTRNILKVSTKEWKAAKALGDYKDYPEGTVLVISTLHPNVLKEGVMG